MPLKLIRVEKCCFCVTDLKTAAAIIAVLGIVTSPAVSWAVVRHSYVIRVSCYLTTARNRADTIDVNVNNVFSYGFGTNAGLGPSCLSQVIVRNRELSEINLRSSNDTDDKITSRYGLHDSSNLPMVFYAILEYYGWFVFLIDLIFLLASGNFLWKIFKGGCKSATLVFMWAAMMSTFLSFVYGMLYVSACISVGGAFPLFEFAFSMLDIVLWAYFLTVVNSYRNSLNPNGGVHIPSIPVSQQRSLIKEEPV